MSDLADIVATALAFVQTLAPLSVVIAAIGFLHNVRQTRIKREHDEAASVREVLNSLGTRAYLLNWSMIGSPPPLVAAGVLHIREAIEARIGMKPSDAEVASFIADKVLSESIVEKAWRDSKVLERFQNEALEFGKLRADLGNRVPIIQAALSEIDTRLRLLFLLNTFVIFSMRNDAGFKTLGKSPGTGSQEPAVSLLHRLLLRASHIPKETAFSEACSFLEKFCAATTTVSDERILLLIRHRRWLQGLRDWWSKRQSRKTGNAQQRALLKRLRENAAGHFHLLRRVAEEIFKTRDQERAATDARKRSATRLLYAVRGNGDRAALEKATQEFLVKMEAASSEHLATQLQLLELRAQGVDDPDIDLLLASSFDLPDLIQAALERGANANVSVDAVLARHEAILRRASQSGC